MNYSQIKWTRDSNIKTIVDTYVNYIRAKFKDSIVVFDGYGKEPTLKDHEHMQQMALEESF